MKKDFLATAIAFAEQHEYPVGLDFRLCALIVRGGSIVSVGYNRFGTSGLIQCFKKTKYHCNVHAEADSILKVRQKVDLNGCKMYVARILRKKDDDQNVIIGLGMPCEMCQEILRAYGIRKVFFTIDNDSTGMMKIRKNK